MFPIMLTLCVTFAIGGSPNGLKLAVINHETETCENMNFNQCTLLSCHAIHQFKQSILHVINYHDYEQIQRDIIPLKLIGFISFGQNFTNYIVNAKKYKDFLKNREENFKIQIYEKNAYLYSFTMEALYDSYLNFTDVISSLCNHPKKFFTPPINFLEPIFKSSFKLTYFLATIAQLSNSLIVLGILFYFNLSSELLALVDLLLAFVISLKID
jgi:hypothetical protein